MGRSLKFMGTSHVKIIRRGEDFAGRLATPLAKDVVFDFSNNHTVDAEAAGLSDEAVDLLVELDNFRDVTGLKRVPVGGAAKMWQGADDTGYREPSSEVVEQEPSTPTTPTPVSPLGGLRPPGDST